MPTKLQRAILEALTQGYQVHPEAVALLQSLTQKMDLPRLINDVIEIKLRSQDQGLVLRKEDLQQALPEGLREGLVVGMIKAEVTEIKADVKVVSEPSSNIQPPAGIEGFKSLFRSRYEKLLKIVMERPDSRHIQKISTLRRGETSSTYKIAGLVFDKKMRRSHTELTIDDDSGSIGVMAIDEGARKSSDGVSLDQMVVLDIQFSKKGLAVAKTIYPPDIPDHRPSFAGEPVYALLTSDLHVGSKSFLLEAFQRLILWLSGRMGEEDLVRKVKYLVIAGDIVDGIGVYPEQEKELEELDAQRQYVKVAQLLEQIPKHINIFIIPGDHDPSRKALPQPAISRKYATPLYELENITMLGNPTHLRLHGVNLLVYHGRSLVDVVATTPGVTFSDPARAMKVLLRARHLAPMYGGRTPISPEQEDYLVVEDVPDIFHAGHLHTMGAEYYRGTLIVNSGTWQAQTRYQANIGIEPTPAILPVVNLATLEIGVRDFSKPAPHPPS